MTDQPEKKRPQFVTPDELAEMFQIPKTWILRYTRQGEIPHLKFGRSYRFDLNSKEFQDWLITLKSHRQ